MAKDNKKRSPVVKPKVSTSGLEVEKFTPTPTIKMHYVYLIKSIKDKNFYIGSTNDLRRRLDEHNNGLVFSTKLRVPFELVYYEAYRVEKDARQREKNLKLRSRAFAQLKKRIQNSLKI